MTHEDAKRYLKEVKRAFANEAGKYATFRQVLLDFKNGRIDVHALLLMAKELLQGHNELVAGFNNFVPRKDHIKLDEDDASEDKLNKLMGLWLKLEDGTSPLRKQA